jgi:hypothetical protein
MKNEFSVMNFIDWIEFEADRILRLGDQLEPEHKNDYIKVQIVAALKKAFAHGRDGLTTRDEPRANAPWED